LEDEQMREYLFRVRGLVALMAQELGCSSPQSLLQYLNKQYKGEFYAEMPYRETDVKYFSLQVYGNFVGEWPVEPVQRLPNLTQTAWLADWSVVYFALHLMSEEAYRYVHQNVA